MTKARPAAAPGGSGGLLIRLGEGLSSWGAFLSAVSLGFLVALTLAEILARSLFGVSLLITSEYGGYLLLVSVSLGFGATLRDDSLIRITMLRSAARPAWRRRMDLMACLLAAGICCFGLWHSVRMVLDHKELDILADSIAETPLWIPQLAVPLGFVLFLLQLAATAARILAGTGKGGGGRA